LDASGYKADEGDEGDAAPAAAATFASVGSIYARGTASLLIATLAS